MWAWASSGIELFLIYFENAGGSAGDIGLDVLIVAPGVSNPRAGQGGRWTSKTVGSPKDPGRYVTDHMLT